MGVLQWNGKWPFRRFHGVQEPASSFFSFCNAAPHLYHLARPSARRAYAPRGWWMSLPNLVYSSVGLVCWVVAGCFHARDTFWTEKLDYFSSTLFITVGCWASLVRLCGPLSAVSAAAVTGAAAAAFTRYVASTLLLLLLLLLLHCCLLLLLPRPLHYYYYTTTTTNSL